MTLDDEIVEYLEHHGIKGMHWGVRKSTSGGVNKTGSSIRRKIQEHPVATKRIAKGAAFAGALFAAAAIGKSVGGRNKISETRVTELMNNHAARVLINEGHRFTRTKVDSELLFNAARQIKEGLRD